MRKSIVVSLVLCMSALVTSSAFALVAVNQSATQLGTPAVEHMKPTPITEAAPPPAIKTIAKRSDSFAASKSPMSRAAAKDAPPTTALDMATLRCVKRPLSSGKPGETVTVCE